MQLTDGPPFDLPGEPRTLSGTLAWRCLQPFLEAGEPGASVGPTATSAPGAGSPAAPFAQRVGLLHVSGAVAGELGVEGQCNDREVGFDEWRGVMELGDGGLGDVILRPAGDGLVVVFGPEKGGSFRQELSGIVRVDVQPTPGDRPLTTHWSVSGTMDTAGGPVEVSAWWDCVE
jgi:hypothetical protein